MGQLVVIQEVVVEEVAERAVADVVEQPGHPQQLLEQGRRGAVRKDGVERWSELLGEAPGQVHGSQRMLEAAVLRGGKHPARGLQLRDAPQALHPRGVEHVLLGGLPRDRARARVEDVVVDGVGDESAPLVGVGRSLHRLDTRVLSASR